MTQQVIKPGAGKSYDWSSDHIFIKVAADLTGGQVTFVEDTLKPGFHLARHFHKKTTEIFYILEGAVRFVFEGEVVIATPGTMVSIHPAVHHEVDCEGGGRLLTIFCPGGFDRYLAEIAALSEERLASGVFMTELAEKYDTWAA